MGPIVNTSATSMDALTGTGLCGSGASALPGVLSSATHAQGRCGYGPRLPLLVISPFSKKNYVDHTVTDQSSILRFVEDNWLGSQRIPGSFDTLAGRINTMFDFKNPDTTPLILNTTTGLVTQY
jgi:phospholipase C